MFWLGSVAWDGYPQGMPASVLDAADERSFVSAVLDMIAGREDGTNPEQGWPWPWEDSCTTDFAYTWTTDGVRASCFGGPWCDPHAEPPEHDGPKVPMPNMTAIQRVDYGKRSGAIFLNVDG
jgi:hypothetical protein